VKIILRRLLLSLLCLVIIVGCTFFGPHGTQKVKESNEQGSVEGRLTREKIPCDRWTWWYPNGKVRRKGSYHQGRPIGRWETWFANGLQQAVFHYSSSPLGPPHATVPEETWQHWYPNGQLRYRVTFVHGVLEGLGEVWYDSGVKKFEGTFLKGKRTGTWSAWRKDGALAGRGTYDQNGSPIGKWTVYKPDGSEASFREGIGPWIKHGPSVKEESIDPLIQTSVLFTVGDGEPSHAQVPFDVIQSDYVFAEEPLVAFTIEQEYPFPQINSVWFDEFRIELGFSEDEL